MILKKCLLVTDDPDDHQAFSDAIAEITENAVVLNILDSQKALRFLLEKSYTPDFIFLDLSMHGIRINSFLKSIRSDAALKQIPIALYGEGANFQMIDNTEDMASFNKNYEYSELKNFLTRFLEV